MGDVIDLDIQTTQPVSPEKVIKAALAADLETVLIIGYEKDGKFYFAGSISDVPDTNFILDEAKQELWKSKEQWVKRHD